uniref:Liprin-beta-1-like n=1 Tax=Phallusia mammillata TaxID=59560 RepID=A0A6F9DPV4_9ASCI|nr:liprin-beta-1-like [Phallusia mammillata]
MEGGDELENMVEMLNRRAASDMLEDAIQHFDNIIDANTNGPEAHYSDEESANTEFNTGVQGVALLMEDLRNAVEATLDVEVDNDEERKTLSQALLKHISSDTLSFYRKLFKIEPPKNESESDKVKRLIAENDSLTLQVSVLSDQVELQTEKLVEVETQLNEANERLEGADARLREEVEAKTSLETQKLQLMNEMANYKINCAQQQQQKQQDVADINELERKKQESESRNDQYKFVLSKLNKMKQKVVEVQREKLECGKEIEILKGTIENLKKSLTEKDQLVEDLKQQIQLLKANPASKVSSPDEGIVQDHDEKEQRLLQLRMPAPYATSTPISNEMDSKKIPLVSQPHKNTDVPDVAIGASLNTPKQSGNKGIRSQSLEKLHGMRVGGGVGEMRRSSSQEEGLSQQANLSGSSGILSDASSPSKRGPWENPKSPPKSKSSSTPNLAMTEIRQVDPAHDTPTHAPTNQNSPFHQRKKHGFRKFFSSFRLRRSRSTSLEPGANLPPPGVSTEQDENNFKRGGIRATAGPRLGWNPRDANQKMTSTLDDQTPFTRWQTDRICQWLMDIGLHMYIEPCKKWVKNGDTLLRATNQELEKELGIRNPLHKKKLMLHLQAQGEEEDGGQAKMDGVWVSRWLDDIGLPQYKDQFHESCVDGRLIHHMTVSDAQKLRITNLFHLLSLRRAVEVLRICQFDPTRLKRRPLEGEEKDDVSLWTNHRVMEWLRSADLAEYAPNLRGSGVHGAVLVLEPLFTAETLSALLHIPHSKTLLRRHLAAKLKELLPPESTKEKEERSQAHGYQPVNVNVKYKIGRRSFGGLGRLRGSSAASSSREFGSGEYVCPISSACKTMQGHRSDLERRMQVQGAKRTVDADDVVTDDVSGSGSDNIEVVELNESTTREINAFSTQLNSLTSNWKEL